MDDVLAGQRRLEHHPLDVVDRVEDRIGDPLLHHLEGVGARPPHGVAAAGEVVADEHLTGDRVGDDEVEIVDQLDAGGGIAGRVGPHQREVEGPGGGHLVGREPQAQRLAAAGGELTGEARQLDDGPVAPRKADAAVEGTRQAGTAPAPVVHHRAEARGVEVGRGSCAVDDHGLEGGGLDEAGHGDARALPELLDLGQHAGHRRGGHAGAGEEPVPGGHGPVEIVEHGVLDRIGVVLVLEPPLGRTGREDLGSGRHHVGLEAAVAALDADAHVAPAREVGHLGVAVGRGAQDQVGGQLGVGARLPELPASGPDDIPLVVDHHGVGEVALALERTHGDDVLGVARHGDRAAQAADAVVAALTGVARGEDEEDGLLAGGIGERVAGGRVVARRDRIVLVGAGVAPTVVGDEGVGHRRLLLQEGVGDGRAGLQVDRQHEELRIRREAAELGIGHRALGRSLDLQGSHPAAGDGSGHMGAVTVGVGEEVGLGSDGEDPVGGEVGMGPIDARVVDVHHHVAAGEATVGGRVGDVGGAPQKEGRAVVEQFPAMGLLDEVHLGRPGQRHQGVGRHVHGHQGAEGAALADHLADPERLETRQGIGVGEREHQPVARVEGAAIDGTGQQFGFELEGRMPGRHRGDVGVEGQALHGIVGTLHEERIDGQVRDHVEVLLLQPAPGFRIGLVRELDDVEARFGARHQRFRQGQRFTGAGVDQGVAQHQRPGIGTELVDGLVGVAGAPGELGILRGRPATGGQGPDGQALGGDMRRDGQGPAEDRSRIGDGRGRRGGRPAGIHGRWPYPAVQPQGTHRQGDGDDQASGRAHDENGMTGFSPWSARDGPRPPGAGFG